MVVSRGDIDEGKKGGDWSSRNGERKPNQVRIHRWSGRGKEGKSFRSQKKVRWSEEKGITKVGQWSRGGGRVRGQRGRGRTPGKGGGGGRGIWVFQVRRKANRGAFPPSSNTIACKRVKWKRGGEESPINMLCR